MLEMHLDGDTLALDDGKPTDSCCAGMLAAGHLAGAGTATAAGYVPPR